MDLFLEATLNIAPASQFSLEELTEAYNQTRQDYIVPMPMTVSRLRDYIKTYDVDLDASCVVFDKTDSKLIYGLGMLGVRPDRAWITRLGVLPYTRRMGTGQRLMHTLISAAKQRGKSEVWLEVIKGNEPAHRMFTKNGFVETRELVVCRRPPANPMILNGTSLLHILDVDTLKYEEMLQYLWFRKDRYNWLNQTETFVNLPHSRAKIFNMEGNQKGIVFYEHTALQLKRVLVEVLQGDPVDVSTTILHWLHSKYPLLDAACENLAVNDPRIVSYKKVGYFDSFHRVEMVLRLKGNGRPVSDYSHNTHQNGNGSKV